jgi:hypothetical protein
LGDAHCRSTPSQTSRFRSVFGGTALAIRSSHSSSRRVRRNRRRTRSWRARLCCGAMPNQATEPRC